VPDTLGIELIRLVLVKLQSWVGFIPDGNWHCSLARASGYGMSRGASRDDSVLGRLRAVSFRFLPLALLLIRRRRFFARSLLGLGLTPVNPDTHSVLLG